MLGQNRLRYNLQFPLLQKYWECWSYELQNDIVQLTLALYFAFQNGNLWVQVIRYTLIALM